MHHQQATSIGCHKMMFALVDWSFFALCWWTGDASPALSQTAHMASDQQQSNALLPMNKGCNCTFQSCLKATQSAHGIDDSRLPLIWFGCARQPVPASWPTLKNSSWTTSISTAITKASRQSFQIHKHNMDVKHRWYKCLEEQVVLSPTHWMFASCPVYREGACSREHLMPNKHNEGIYAVWTSYSRRTCFHTSLRGFVPVNGIDDDDHIVCASSAGTSKLMRRKSILHGEHNTPLQHAYDLCFSRGGTMLARFMQWLYFPRKNIIQAHGYSVACSDALLTRCLMVADVVKAWFLMECSGSTMLWFLQLSLTLLAIASYIFISFNLSQLPHHVTSSSQKCHCIACSVVPPRLSIHAVTRLQWWLPYHAVVMYARISMTIESLLALLHIRSWDANSCGSIWQTIRA